MHPGKALRVGDGLGNFGNAEAGGVAAQNSVLRHDGAQPAVEIVLDLQLFQDGLHQEIGVRQLLQPVGEGNAANEGGGLLCRQLAAGHLGLLVQGDHVPRFGQGGGEEVIEPDGVSGGGEGLGQGIAHGARSGDGNAADFSHKGVLLQK